MSSINAATINELNETERGPQRGAQRRWAVWLLAAVAIVLTLVKRPDVLPRWC